MTLGLAIDLDAFSDLIEGTQHELTVFIVTLALMLAFALVMAVIERAKRSPVERIVTRRGSF